MTGIADDGYYAASDISALVQVTNKVVYLEDGDVALLTHEYYKIFNNGVEVTRKTVISQIKADLLELGTFKNYMQKEIFEQPEVIGRCVEKNHIFHWSKEFGENINDVLILACGTSYHSGLVAKYWFESIARIRCNVEIASEYRYRDSIYSCDTLVITLSQSGETADTLAALQHAKANGMTKTLAICNVDESSIVRESQVKLLTHAGPEIGVASTKAFTTQLITLACVVMKVATDNGQMTYEESHEIVS